MFNFQKDTKEKLYNLFEALGFSIDDFDDETIPISTLKTGLVKEYDIFDKFIENRILSHNDEPLTPLEEVIINKVNNDTEDRYTNRLLVNDTHQLILALKRGARYFGWEGNYNWIDTKKITVMLKLFKNAFNKNVIFFNGDISKWNTSNVTNMFNIFEGCNALTCDISNWNVSNVKFQNASIMKDVNPTLKKIFQKFKFSK